MASRSGSTICYDLRFPELFRILALKGAQAIMLPAAFTLMTGKDHWEPLIRARAIENELYMIAPAQWGTHPPGKWCYGRSMIVDPWGTVVSDGFRRRRYRQCNRRSVACRSRPPPDSVVGEPAT